MTKLASTFLAFGVIFTATHALADDTQRNQPTQDQAMKDCMTRMSAKNDGSTKEQMQSACQAQMKNGMGMGKDGMDMGKKGMGMGKEGMGMGKEGMGGGKDNTSPPKE